MRAFHATLLAALAALLLCTQRADALAIFIARADGSLPSGRSPPCRHHHFTTTVLCGVVLTLHCCPSSPSHPPQPLAHRARRPALPPCLRAEMLLETRFICTNSPLVPHTIES
jgi:hypothetical protein